MRKEGNQRYSNYGFYQSIFPLSRPGSSLTFPMDSTQRRPIQGWGRVVESLSPGRYQVRMANGYVTGAHLDRALRATTPLPSLVPGDEVLVEFSPYEMTQARIVRFRDEKTFTP